MRNEEGRHDTLAIHVTLLPYISTTGELKTKPTQHSVRELRSLGIQPDVIACRSDIPISPDLREKISLFCDVPPNAVIPLMTMPSIYQVPLVLEDAGLTDIIIDKLNITARSHDLVEWKEWVERLQNPKHSLEIAVVGKYVELPDAYLSVKEALIHAGVAHDCGVRINWIHSEDVKRVGAETLLAGMDGIVVPGGFGERGFEGKVEAARYARLNNVPYLGLCFGLHVMAVEFARAHFNTDQANSTELDPETPYPVITLLDEQRRVVDKGGTMRLGSYECKLVPGTMTHDAYGVDSVSERHRHRWEFNNEYREEFARAGLIASGTSPDGGLVEILELRDHAWMIGSQFHPELRSRPNRPHPLFTGFIGASLSRQQERRGPDHAEAPVRRSSSRARTPL
jgi:CTP synthase